MTTLEPSKVHPRRRRWRRLLLLAAGLLLLALGGYVVLYLRAQRIFAQELREAIADTDRRDPGWRLDDLDLQRKVIPDERNGALQVITVERLLPAKWPPEGVVSTVDDFLGDLPPQEQFTEEELRTLRSQLQPVLPALKAADRLADLPDGRFPIAYQVDFMATRVPEAQESRKVADLLGFEALRRAQDGDVDGACGAERALINVARAFDEEYSLVLLKMRTAVLLKGTRAVERTLAQGEPGEESLVALQQLLEQEEAETFALTVTAVRGERALGHAMMEALEQGRLSLSARPNSPSFGQRLTDALTDGMVRHSHALYLQYMTDAVELAHLGRPEEVIRQKKFPVVPEEETARLAHLLAPAVGKVLRGESNKLAELRGAIAMLALERYRRAEGTWPESLESLVPRYLREVPTDPHDDEPLRYRRLDDGVVVYSLGPDRIDDGGNIDRKSLVRDGGADLGFRLWDVARRRQLASSPRRRPDPN